jgi:tight adherence protein B
MLIASIVFVLVLLGTVAIFTLFGSTGGAERERVKDRLLGKSKPKKSGGQSAPALIKGDDQGTKNLSLKLLLSLRLNDRLTELLEQAGLRWKPASFVQGCLALALVGFNLVWYMARPPFNKFAVLFGVLGACLPYAYVARIRKKRLYKFEEQFPDSLEFISRSMRAGHAFSVSLEMLHREFSEPLSAEFRRTFDEQNLGLPLEIALQKLSKRVPSLDVHFFVSSVLLQKRTGGNLAELLDKLAQLIRERFKLRGRIRAISAHGRMTATALSCIPMAVAVLMFYTNPDYVMFFFSDPTGQIMMGLAIFFQVVGYLVMKKIVAIEV